jgi:uncharacterized Zn finger protein
MSDQEEMVDILRITYRCSECSSRQEHEFKIGPDTIDEEIVFHCSNCGLENSVKIKCWDETP